MALIVLIMIACGLISFSLLGRISERTHVALAMLGVLAGSFGLLVLFGATLYQNPLAAIFVLLFLIALFKFMSQIETGGVSKLRPKQ